MDVLFNEELFDRLTTSQLETLIKGADDVALNKLIELHDFIKFYHNAEAGFEDNESEPLKEIIPITVDLESVLELPRYSILNEKLYDALSIEQLFEMFDDSREILLKKIRDVGGAAKIELNQRQGIKPEEDHVETCTKADKFRGAWIDEMHCGTFENYQGLLVFRPKKDLILYHGSESFKSGDPVPGPLWFGSYDNSLQYAKNGYMNIFRIKKSPRLLVLTDVKNINKVLRTVSPQDREAISKVTGIEQTDLNSIYRQFGCGYKNKDPQQFSRFSSRKEDMIMAESICKLPGIDGYMQPEINYCSGGSAYRDGKELPAAKRFNGEIVLCDAKEFVKRVTPEAIECPNGSVCDISAEDWKRELAK